MTEQIEELIQHIRDYHLRLAARYQLLAEDSTQSKRVALIFEYLSEHELKLAGLLEKQLRNRPEFTHILQTWLKEKPQEPSSEGYIKFAEQLPMIQYSTADVLKTVTQQHNHIAEIYRQLADICAAESLRAFFENLAQHEANELKCLISGIDEFRTL